MNPIFTKVTLNSFIFVTDIFCTGPKGKMGLLVLLHIIMLVSVYYTHSQWNEVGEGMKSNRQPTTKLIQLIKILYLFKSSLMSLVIFFPHESYAIKNHGKIALILI